MSRLESLLDHLVIPAPCPEDWARMAGDEGRRYCGVCAEEVTNLSARTREEADAFLAERPGACVRVWVDEAGRTLHRPATWARLGARLAAAVSAGALLQACETAQATPAPERDEPSQRQPVDGGVPTPRERPLAGKPVTPPHEQTDAGTVVPPPPPPRPLMGAPPPTRREDLSAPRPPPPPPRQKPATD